MSGSGRIAVVTGAGSGIGKASALALLAKGWRVVLVGRDRPRLEAVAGEGATARVADVRDPASVAALFGWVQAEFGRLDLLFNNAGVFGRGGPVDEVSDEDWDDVVATNLSGAQRGGCRPVRCTCTGGAVPASIRPTHTARWVWPPSSG